MLLFQTIFFYLLQIDFNYVPFTSGYCNFFYKQMMGNLLLNWSEHHKLFLSSICYEWVMNVLAFLNDYKSAVIQYTYC